MFPEIILFLRYSWSYIFGKQKTDCPVNDVITDEAIHGFLDLHRQYQVVTGTLYQHDIWRESLSEWANQMELDVISFCTDYHSGDIEIHFVDDDLPMQ